MRRTVQGFVPDQVRKACIISNTPEPLKTHLKLNVGRLGNFNALRVPTEDYLRSRRIFKTTSAGNTHDEDSMEVDSISRKGERHRKIWQGHDGWQERKRKPLRQRLRKKRQQNTHDSKMNVETMENMGTKHLIVGTSRRTKSQGKGKSTGKSKSKVTEISESDNSKQVDDWCPSSHTSAQQANLSQVNTIGCADEELWIFSLEASKKRRYTVNWEEQSRPNPTDK